MRPLFPSRSRALHERLNEANLPHACTVEVAGTRTTDDEGGSSAPWIPYATLPCRVSPIGTASERMQAEQVTPYGRYQVVFERATVIPLAARLTVEVDGETLVLNPHGSNGPRSFEAQRKYECSIWGAATPAAAS